MGLGGGGGRGVNVISSMGLRRIVQIIKRKHEYPTNAGSAMRVFWNISPLLSYVRGVCSLERLYKYVNILYHSVPWHLLSNHNDLDIPSLRDARCRTTVSNASRAARRSRLYAP